MDTVTKADLDLRAWFLRRDGDLKHMEKQVDMVLARHRISSTTAKDELLREAAQELRATREHFASFLEDIAPSSRTSETEAVLWRTDDLATRIDTALSNEPKGEEA